MALSSAEAEFYAMVDAVQRVKYIRVVAGEVGVRDGGVTLVFKTDSSAAKSFVSERGLENAVCRSP